LRRDYGDGEDEWLAADGPQGSSERLQRMADNIRASNQTATAKLCGKEHIVEMGKIESLLRLRAAGPAPAAAGPQIL
jgi:hypothetical protein